MSWGSPPHTRGILGLASAPPKMVRFTPAYAGNTSSLLYCRKLCRVHPRIRGEYSPPTGRKKPRRGSPPHTRGIHSCSGVSVGCPRFTPAYAGNTAVSFSGYLFGQVHPRIRGEYRSSIICRRTGWGSPPHTRGIPGALRIYRVDTGFTPAYAGNTKRRTGL